MSEHWAELKKALVGRETEGLNERQREASKHLTEAIRLFLLDSFEHGSSSPLVGGVVQVPAQDDHEAYPVAFCIAGGMAAEELVQATARLELWVREHSLGTTAVSVFEGSGEELHGS